jgi:soluble lytic murein transglycosylase-like protein
MKYQAFLFSRKLGMIIHGKRIWFSEFLSIFAMIFFIGVFSFLAFWIFLNETKIRKNVKNIAMLETNYLLLKKQINEELIKAKISDALNISLKERLAPKTLYILSNIIYSNSLTFGYDPLLLLAVIETESKFYIDAKGKFKSGLNSGALGLMQIKFETAQEIAKALGINLTHPDNLFEPEINIALGVAYLTQLISKFKSFKLGLVAYNQGPMAVINMISQQQVLPTSYYNKVLASYYKFKRITDSLENQINLHNN